MIGAVAKAVLGGVVSAALLLAWPAWGGKPRLGLGRDPGGVAIAIIGRGVDYTQPGIADRLARDGEGIAVALDLVDGDIEPYTLPGVGDDALARTIIEEGPASRLVILRTPANAPPALVAALQFTAATPARAAVLVPHVEAPIPGANLADAARRLPDLLIIVPARLVGLSAVGVAGDALVVAGLAGGSARPDAINADVSVTVEAVTGASSTSRLPDDIASARVAALAARLVTATPELRGAALKARILALATASPRGRYIGAGELQARPK
jgi:hypothetical protein